jgi:hypothetical protein
MADTQITTQIGSIYNEVTGDTIPIYGLEQIDIGREQSWELTPLNVQGGLAQVWKGPMPIEYQVDFELFVGWGKVTSRGVLFDMCKAFHAMGAHQKGNGTLAMSPPPCICKIGAYIDERGFFKNVRTVALPPWGGKNASNIGSRDTPISTSDGLPTSVRFTGIFFFAPGFDRNAAGAEFGLKIDLNNERTNMTTVRKSFYTVKD